MAEEDKEYYDSIEDVVFDVVSTKEKTRDECFLEFLYIWFDEGEDLYYYHILKNSLYPQEYYDSL